MRGQYSGCSFTPAFGRAAWSFKARLTRAVPVADDFVLSLNRVAGVIPSAIVLSGVAPPFVVEIERQVQRQQQVLRLRRRMTTQKGHATETANAMAMATAKTAAGPPSSAKDDNQKGHATGILLPQRERAESGSLGP
ncbi:MAG: hypothetical protein ACRD3K_05625 [Edaphobacter sp.]